MYLYTEWETGHLQGHLRAHLQLKQLSTDLRTKNSLGIPSRFRLLLDELIPIELVDMVAEATEKVVVVVVVRKDFLKEVADRNKPGPTCEYMNIS